MDRNMEHLIKKNTREERCPNCYKSSGVTIHPTQEELIHADKALNNRERLTFAEMFKDIRTCHVCNGSGKVLVANNLIIPAYGEVKIVSHAGKITFIETTTKEKVES